MPSEATNAVVPIPAITPTVTSMRRLTGIPRNLPAVTRGNTKNRAKRVILPRFTELSL